MPLYISLAALGVSCVIRRHVWIFQSIRSMESFFRDQPYAVPFLSGIKGYSYKMCFLPPKPDFS